MALEWQCTGKQKREPACCWSWRVRLEPEQAARQVALQRRQLTSKRARECIQAVAARLPVTLFHCALLARLEIGFGRLSIILRKKKNARASTYLIQIECLSRSTTE